MQTNALRKEYEECGIQSIHKKIWISCFEWIILRNKAGNDLDELNGKN